MEGQEGPMLPKEYPPIENRYLTLFEHRFIGGSEEAGGKFYDTPTFEKDYIEGKGVLPPEYSQTQAELRDKIDPERIKSIRKEHYIVGTPSMFGGSSIDIWEDGYNIGIELPEDGNVNGEWRVFLIPIEPGNSVNRPDVLAKLAVSGRIAKFFKFDPKEGHILMRLKTWEEYNAV